MSAVIRAHFVCGLFVVGSALSTPTAHAQTHIQERSGVTASYGRALAAGSLSCDSCATNPTQIGWGGRLSFGYAVRHNMVVAVELEGGGSDRGPGWRGMTWSTLAVQWYPRDASGWFAKLGVGATFGTIGARSSANSPYQYSRGRGGTLGIGYDHYVFRVVSMTPYATLGWSTHNTLRTSLGESSVRFGGSMLHAGLAITVH